MQAPFLAGLRSSHRWRRVPDMQRENQRRKEQQLGADVEDTTHELERLTRTYESLMKVEGEQRILIDKLSNSEL